MADFVPGADDDFEESLGLPEDVELYTFNADDEDEEKSKKDELAERLAAAEARAAEQDRRLQLLQEQALSKPTTTYVQQPQFVPGAATTAPAPVNKELLQQKLWEDPIGFLGAYGEEIKKQVLADARKEMVPLQGAAARNAILAYRQSASMPKEVAKEFDELLAGVDLSNARPDQIPDQIKAVELMAYGKAAQKGFVPTSSARPTNLGGTATRGSSKPVAGKITRELTRKQAENVKMAREFWGLSDKEIQKALDAGEYD